ncbi:MAG: hypothetical protein IJB47_00940 [Oscillospiraceae bacterium]|nr:hypothetical protein [Oscillospiraceae bacterium]
MKNMKWFTRMLALLLVATMVLAGCGKTNVDSTEPTNNKTPDNNGETPYWELLDEVQDTSDLPTWTGDKLEVTIWVSAGSDASMGNYTPDAPVWKELERVTGVIFNHEESYGNGGGSIDAKLPMVIASGRLPHVILGYGCENQLLELFQEDYLVDLTPYYEDGTLDQLTKVLPVEECTPYIYKNYMDEEGSIYAIPVTYAGSEINIAKVWDAANIEVDGYDPQYYATYGDRPHTWSGIGGDAVYIRDDVLQAVRPGALTLEDIRDIYMEDGTFTEEQLFDVGLKSADDFWKLLRDIKAELDANPGKYTDFNGETCEVMQGSFVEGDNWRYSVNLCQWLYQIPANTDYFCFADYTPESEDDLLQWAFLSDFYVDHWRELSKLVREDVISKNSWVDNNAIFNEKLYAGHYLVCYGGLNLQEAGGYTYRPIWVDAPYNAYEVGGFSTVNYLYPLALFKDAFTDEELEQFLHCLNYLNSDVGCANFLWGPESAGWVAYDENGDRYFVDEDVEEYMLDASSIDGNEDPMWNGLFNIYGHSCVWWPLGVRSAIVKPSYTLADTMERREEDAIRLFCPGILEGRSEGENSVFMNSAPQVHVWGMQFEYCQQFWNARTGFEDRIKKMIVSETDADFDKQLAELKAYTEANGLTDENLADFNAKYVEENRDLLVAAGIID